MPLLRERAITGRHHFKGASLELYVHHGLLRAIADRAGVRVPPLGRIADAPPLPARLYHDQWIVECPDCHDAQFVWPETPQYLCAYCFNARLGGRWRRVAIPKESVRGEIEAIVGHRLFPHQRNWVPGETADDLRAENVDHGVSLPLTREEGA